MSHTTKPWVLCSGGDYGDYEGKCRVILAGDRRIAVVLVSDDETHANARLIAAAPELLEALIRVADWLDAKGMNDDRSWGVRLAITKATKETE